MANDQPFSWTDALIAEDEVETPIRITDRLSYHIPGHKLQELQARPQATTYWSHEWYRDSNGKKVKISYSSTREQSEELAKRFLKERVLGFDMEWKADFTRKNAKSGNKRKNSRTLKDEISLIQVASADEIGLFHIALHKGTRPVELIARSLREIIESNAIIKTGVGIYSADASRLRSYMKFQPRGMLDLNHLHRLVDISSGRKMIGLSEHARIYLGFPLFKGKVRTSDWTKTLTTAQQNYAASDAYVGLVLYHVLDVRRLNMDPIPPHPETDKNPNPKSPAGDFEPQPMRRSTVSEPMLKAQVDSRRDLGRATDTVASTAALSLLHSTAIEPAQRGMDLPTPAPMLPQTSPPKNEDRRLLANLHSLRFRLQRSTGLPLESIAGDETLAKMVKQRPDTVPALCRIPGAVKFYQLCKSQNINLLDCITTPPTSISFDSSLSLVTTKSAKTWQLQGSAAVSHTGGAQDASSSKKRRRSCSFNGDEELASASSDDSIAVATEQGCTAQDPISVLSSPVFFETLDTARDRKPVRPHKRDALAEIHNDNNAQPLQFGNLPSSGKPNSTTKNACARRAQPVGCSASHVAGTDGSRKKDSYKSRPNLASFVLPGPPLVHLDLTSHTDDRAYSCSTSVNKKLSRSGTEPSLSHTSGFRTRNITSTRREALGPSNPKSSPRRRRRKEETQVILDTQLATAALDFQLSSDPPSPHPEHRSRNNHSPPRQRLIVPKMPELDSRTDSRHMRIELDPKSSRETTPPAPPSSSDYEANTSLFVGMMETDVAKGGPPARRIKQLAEEDLEPSFHSASADTDYGANDSLFLAAMEAEEDHDAILPKIARVHRSSSVESFVDARSSFTVA
ncbi:hypothetical protein BLS_007596 [Venturia inaequalis]|uniref:HRDC domain-containing protein n=1 Tax=Venturia inaequalis TaxID=5025 RepID=A0A8H3VF48_VENIN|nr:hypothetical protein BLS_007596 [Venturia inaequalis]KAE9986407.1 hypothetical protein EG327_004375 [Venturia inaequalis]KAE9988054.1 hypothetical protein EG328_000524 [Venturia inaequalis]RDI79218.1 hypothetical protein Vi05172_g10810 [Venturia inaequalis]